MLALPALGRTEQSGAQAKPASVAAPAVCDSLSFAPAVNYLAGIAPISVAVGDFNADGFLDLAAANFNSNNISVLLGNAGGTFQSAVNYTVGTQPDSVAVGDFNSDGDPDLAVANYGVGANSVSILRGSTGGTFQSAVNYTVGTQPASVAVSDFNRDGNQDLVTANYGSANVSVLLGNGISFGSAVNSAAGANPYSVAVGRFNADSLPDLAVANYTTANVSVLMGNAGGTFQSAVNYPVGTNPASVAVGDFNADSLPDLAVANYGSANVYVLLGNAGGTFQSAVNYPVGTQPASVAVGDLNGDGRPDLATGNQASNNVSVLQGNADGTFQSAVNYPAHTGSRSVAVRDFNGDGRLDLAVTNFSSNDVSILLNNCVLLTGTPTNTPTVTGTPTITPTITSTRTFPPTATATCALEGWTPVFSPNGPGGNNILYSVAAVSSDDVWAVGYSGSPGPVLIEHWNGGQWISVPGQNPGSSGNVLRGVTALATNDVWAVGYYNDGTVVQTLVEHYDGSAWNIVIPTSPSVGSSATYLYGVAAVATNDVWAVGYYYDGTNYRPISLHYYNGAWSIMINPGTSGSTNNFLNGVTAISSNDIWAVGYSVFPGYNFTLIEHYDGSQWTVEPTGATGVLNGVKAVSGGEVWAVGTYNSGSGNNALILHYVNGQWYSEYDVSPNPSSLTAVSALSSSDVWAVGNYQIGAVSRTLTMRRNQFGSWRIVPSGNTGIESNRLNGVAVVSSSDAWAAGFYTSGSLGQTLTERYGNPCAPTSTLTTTPTSTPCGAPAVWSDGPNIPSNMARGAGVWFANGLNRFYVMGGRTADTASNELASPSYYDPAFNNWVVDSAVVLPDTQVNNMACADLNGPGGHQIYCVGGSSVAASNVATNRVFSYSPTAHTVTTNTLSSDPWPAEGDGITLPGGYAVVNNKLYILGGLRINTNTSNRIWEFDPNRAASTRWRRKFALVPNGGPNSTGMAYIPVAAVGTNIYAGGGSQYVPNGNSIDDSPVAFKYDTVSDTVDDAGIPDLPSPGNGETRALNVNNQVWVIGGGRTSPNPSNGVLIFDPANPGAGWTTGPSFAGSGRRNFAVDIRTSPDANGNLIYMVGGYAPSPPPTNTMQIYTVGRSCGTATPTNTLTPTATPAGIVNGHLTWQGITQPNARNQGLTATLTLCNGSVTAYTGTVTTDQSGNFTATTGLPNGNYTWHLKGRKSLATSGTLTISGGSTTQEFGTQEAGDSNDSNVVNAQDFTVVKNTFGKSLGQPGYDERGDFSNDNIVNATDFNLLRGNYGLGGAAVTCP